MGAQICGFVIAIALASISGAVQSQMEAGCLLVRALMETAAVTEESCIVFLKPCFKSDKSVGY